MKINNIPVASIGTLGIKYKNKIIKSNLTSPETTFLHQSLEKIKQNKIENVIIEASSHGLHQGRIDHLNLLGGIFTNFSQDHLDYHKNMRSYLNSKLLLFNKILTKTKSIITDSSIKEFPKLKKIRQLKKLKLIDIKNIKEKLNKISYLNLNEFQLKNLSMAIAFAKLCKINEKNIFRSLNKIQDVDGRLRTHKIFLITSKSL